MKWSYINVSSKVVMINYDEKQRFLSSVTKNVLRIPIGIVEVDKLQDSTRFDRCIGLGVKTMIINGLGFSQRTLILEGY